VFGGVHFMGKRRRVATTSQGPADLAAGGLDADMADIDSRTGWRIFLQAMLGRTGRASSPSPNQLDRGAVKGSAASTAASSATSSN